MKSFISICLLVLMVTELSMTIFDVYKHDSIVEAKMSNMMEEKESNENESTKEKIKSLVALDSQRIVLSGYTHLFFTDIAFYVSECHKMLLEIPPEA